jgi:hypothetical protein
MTSPETPAGSTLAPTPCSQLEPGKTYTLQHKRFGNADVKVLELDGDWIYVEVIKGELVGINDSWGEGEQKSLRKEHCQFYVANDKLTDSRHP